MSIITLELLFFLWACAEQQALGKGPHRRCKLSLLGPKSSERLQRERQMASGRQRLLNLQRDRNGKKIQLNLGVGGSPIGPAGVQLPS